MNSSKSRMYEPPALEVLMVAVESGFAGSDYSGGGGSGGDSGTAGTLPTWSPEEGEWQ